MMQETTFDPAVVDALAASIQATAVAAMWVAGGLVVLAVGLVAVSIKDYFEDAGFLAVCGVVVFLTAVCVFAIYFDEVRAPKYEAIRLLHNRDLEARKLPL